MNELFDVAVLGAGPVGMMAAYYSATRGLRCVLIDTLDKVGGQCSLLYPEKTIYDVASQPGCTGQELIDKLQEQLKNVEIELSLNTSVKKLEKASSDSSDSSWVLETDCEKRINTKAIIFAIGKGAFEPRKLGVAGEDFHGVYYAVQSLKTFEDKNVMIVGAGDSAFDWALALKNKTKSLVQIHRSDKYRAHDTSISQVLEATERNEMKFFPFHEVKEIKGNYSCCNPSPEVSEVVIFDNRTKEEKSFPVDKIIISTGFVTNPGNIAEWGLKTENGKICVDPLNGFRANLDGIFAVGDIAEFPGKVELITTGFGEAATAAYYAYKHIKGDVKGAAWCKKPVKS